MSKLSDNNLEPDWIHGQWRPQSDVQRSNMDPHTRASFDQAAAEYVFGAGFKRDAFGNPVETGRGAPGNMTQSAKAALAKFEAERQAFRVQAGITAEQLMEKS
jgi:hypothetical protein